LAHLSDGVEPSAGRDRAYESGDGRHGLAGIYDYYLFRFRTKEPHWAAKDGWIAGVSGPYLRKDEPTTEPLGGTFSTFTKWDAKTPEEHVGDIRELMKRWRE
jgi:hypothetical protein